MDILNAKPEWVENRCYRVIPVRNSSAVYDEEGDYKLLKPMPNETFIEDEPDDPDLPIIHKGNRFYITMHSPTVLNRHVIGSKGKMKAHLQRNGSTIQVLGGRNAEFSEITVSGPSKAIVSATYHQIQGIITTQRLREEFTHFVSLPINTSEIHKSFIQFKEEILSKYKGVRGIHESIFQIPNKLHVTITPLVLLDEKDIQHAESILNACVENVMKNFGEKQFIVDVKGIEYMNDDPAEVDVLYAKLLEKDGDTSLQVIADKIMKEFVAAELSKDQYENVNLHITLMNTTFRDDHENSEEQSTRRVTFDARPILRDYIDYYFGPITVSEIHISIRFTKGADGYYLASCKKKLK